MHITSTEGAKDQDKQETALNAYTTIIQFGAILAILLLYFGRIREVFAGFFGKNPKGLRLGLNLIYAFLPAAVIGYPVEKLLQHYLFNAWGIWPTVIAWGVGGIAILVVSALQRARLQAVATDAETSAAVQSVGVDELTPKQAFTIGLMQCIAMWPGVSRSLATIFGGLVAGMSMAAAVEFSFLLGFVTLTAATIFELRHFSVIHHYLGSSSPVIGIIFAGIAAFVAVKWMVSYLNKHGLEIFGYYRVVLAIATVALVVMNVLK